MYANRTTSLRRMPTLLVLRCQYHTVFSGASLASYSSRYSTRCEDDVGPTLGMVRKTFCCARLFFQQNTAEKTKYRSLLLVVLCCSRQNWTDNTDVQYHTGTYLIVNIFDMTRWTTIRRRNTYQHAHNMQHCAGTGAWINRHSVTVPCQTRNLARCDAAKHGSLRVQSASFEFDKRKILKTCLRQCLLLAKNDVPLAFLALQDSPGHVFAIGPAASHTILYAYEVTKTKYK